MLAANKARGAPCAATTPTARRAEKQRHSA